MFISSSLQALACLRRSQKMPGDTVDEFGVSALMMAATGGGAEACEAGMGGGWNRDGMLMCKQTCLLEDWLTLP